MKRIKYVKKIVTSHTSTYNYAFSTLSHVLLRFVSFYSAFYYVSVGFGRWTEVFVTMAAMLETSENLSAFQGDITKTEHELLKKFLPQYFVRCPFNRITF